jgi:serine/threonine-protein kinase RsbW
MLLHNSDACRIDILTPEEMIPAIASVVRELKSHGFPDSDIFGIRLCLEEAIGNGIKHGQKKDKSKPVQLRYRVCSAQFLAEVEDQGPGFDPDGLPDPLAPNNVERPGGRGVFLLQRYMTWMQYNETGNCVALCKHRSNA